MPYSEGSSSSSRRSASERHDETPGRGPWCDHPLALDAETIARQLADVARRARHERFAIAGASLDGPLAMKVAALFPEHVTQLISVCAVHVAERIPGAVLLELNGGHGVAQRESAAVRKAIAELIAG